MHALNCLYLHCGPSNVEYTYLETTYKLEGGSIANYCFQDNELTRIRIAKFF